MDVDRDNEIDGMDAIAFSTLNLVAGSADGGRIATSATTAASREAAIFLVETGP